MAPNLALLTISTDVVLFSIRHEQLDVLLVPRQENLWGLPGGYVAMDEDLDGTALLHLAQQTQMQGVYLEQLYTFGRPDRNPRHREVSVAYYGLVPAQKLPPPDQSLDKHYLWFSINELPQLALDHDEIINMAHLRLAAKLAYSTIALQFLPEHFTLSDLQSVYETILGETLDKRNFRKRILAMDCIEATGELSRVGNHRPARLYRTKHPGKIEIIK